MTSLWKYARDLNYQVYLIRWVFNPQLLSLVHSFLSLSFMLSPPLSLKLYLWGAYDKFLEFFGMSTFIESTHMKLRSNLLQV